MSDNTVILEVKELHKSFDGHEVLKGISTTIKKGDVLALSLIHILLRCRAVCTGGRIDSQRR